MLETFDGMSGFINAIFANLFINMDILHMSITCPLISHVCLLNIFLHRFTDVSIIAYTAKYASAFYGPFRCIIINICIDECGYEVNCFYGCIIVCEYVYEYVYLCISNMPHPFMDLLHVLLQ